MTQNKITSLVLIALFVVVKGYSQDFKLAGIQYNNYQKSEIKDAEGREMAFQEFGVLVNVPQKLKNEKTTLIHGIGYGFVEATTYNSLLLESDTSEKELQEFYYRLMVNHQWSEKWSLMFTIKPTLASDFEQKLSSDDFVFQGAAIATRTLNDKFKIGAGLISTTQFGSPRILPAVNFHYKKNRHQINSLLPLNFKYTYAMLPSEKLELGLKYTLKGANFNVYDENLPELNKINYSRANVGILTNYQLSKIFRIEAFGGISTNRKYNFVDAADDTIEFDSEAAPFFSVGIVLVPPKRK